MDESKIPRRVIKKNSEIDTSSERKIKNSLTPRQVVDNSK